MFVILASTGLPADVEERFNEMQQLIRKVELWWIVHVDMDVNPDIVGTEIAPESILPGTEIGVTLLSDIAFGEGQLSARVYEHFRKMFGDIKNQD